MIKAQALQDSLYAANRARAGEGKDEGWGSQAFVWVAVAVCIIALGVLELNLLGVDSPEYAETTFGIAASE